MASRPIEDSEFELLGKAITEYRAKYRLSQEELGKRCGVSRTTISYVESGRLKPTAKIMRQIQMVVFGK